MNTDGMELVHGIGADYKIRQEQDGWWSVYRIHEFTHELISVIQASDKAHALSYISRCECIRVPFNVIE